MATRAADKRFGIPTKVLGTTFRSRLEARWALMFTALGWDWEYEPFDADGYIPDFVIVGSHPLLVEIKPCADTASMVPAALHGISRLRSAQIEGFDALAVLGSVPLPANNCRADLGEAYLGQCTAGIIAGDAWYPMLDPYADCIDEPDCFLSSVEPINELAWTLNGDRLELFSNGWGSWKSYPHGCEKPAGDYAFSQVQRLWLQGRDLTRWTAGA
jgi:hypothetical protein